MITLSICMIVKNEEDVLERCLKCAKKIADEIIIVDTGSTDKTKEIAYKFTDKVYDFEWCYDFSKARNFSFSKASKEYIMWLDADDIILNEDIKKILKLKENLNKNIDMIFFKYNLAIDKNNNPSLSYYRERIVKRNANFKWESPIHEVIVPNGKLKYENIAITHKKIHQSDPKRNIKIFNKMIEKNIKFDARQKFYYARELYYLKEYKKSIETYIDFLNDNKGWTENKINACLDLSNIYDILKDNNNKLKYLFKTFEFDIPRAEICCKIGDYFFNTNKIATAIYWYKEALSKTLDIEKGGFISPDYYSFIPHIQLCLCYDKLQDFKTANEYNELANKDKPINNFYKYNKNYFSKLLNNK